MFSADPCVPINPFCKKIQRDARYCTRTTETDNLAFC